MNFVVAFNLIMKLYYSIFQNFINPFLYLYSSDNVLNYCCWIINKNYIKRFIKNAEKKKWVYFENQLDSYFNKKCHKFSIKLKEQKYNYFTELVIREISKISYGMTITYNEIADKINKPNSNQAVGQACKKNYFPLIIPCHRVISKVGYGGYMGSNKNNSIQKIIKNKLLKLEDISLY